jgi:hypothetical protein
MNKKTESKDKKTRKREEGEGKRRKPGILLKMVRGRRRIANKKGEEEEKDSQEFC